MLNNQEILAPVLIEDLGVINTISCSEKRRYGIWRCHCGKEFMAQFRNIKSGRTKSCGCFHKKTMTLIKTTHGMRKHTIYKIWAKIIQRTSNERNIGYEYYGGRGITVCDRWLHSFENFRDDMLPTWQERLTIDRIDVNGNYEPNNCRWTTQTIQNRNKRVGQKNNTSGYKGVCFDISCKRWMANIGINKKQIKIGRFDNALEAAKAYDSYVVTNNLEHTINGVLFSTLTL